MLSFRSILLPLLFLGSILSTAFAAPHNKPAAANAPTLPTSGLSTPTGLSLKVIALGVGTQNYTCNSTSGTYGSNVALAQLYDATRYLSQHPDQVDTISQQRLDQFTEKSECAEESDYNPRLWHIGEHFFAPTTPVTPTFDLYELDLSLSAKKAGDVAAPDTADDIDWLYLVDNGNGQTRGLKAVYRVETAGGKPPATCTGTEQVYVPYVAQYWFYD